MQEAPKTFFTLATLGTFAGASAAVALLGNTFRALTGINAAWPPFLCALVVSAFAAHQLKALDDLVTGGFLVVLNACILFWSALGMQETALSLKPTVGGARPQGRGNVNFWSGWFR
jgi:hypothetical protein